MKYGYVHRWLAFVIAAASALPLRANPTGGSVAAGSAAIAGEGTSAVTVNQASNLAIINWQTFSIATGQSTTFLQPSASSAALNRVLGGQTSIINGTLTANGSIYLINGNGIVVGPGGVISANAFTASTRDISDADFLAGDLEFIGANNAGVENYGTITALGGNVVLIGKTVSNAGTINAPNGTAGLVAGDDVLLAQQNADGSTITVNPDPLATSAAGKVGVKNSGTINAAAAELKAANGNIYALAIQNSGIIRATTVQKQGGHIWLTADSGTVENTGTLNASATVAGGTGGTVTIKSTGGTAANSGAILAEGGQGGAGGDAELSGAVLQYNGTVNLTAPGGTTGDLLLDPDTLEIVASDGNGTIGMLPSTGDSTIDASALDTALNGANITLQANDSISVNAAVNASGNANGGDLTLDAPTLTFNAPVTLYSGSTLSGNATTVNVGAAGLVQNGIDAAAAGGTVNLAAATYDLTSEVLINKSLTVDGSTTGSTILDGQGETRVLEIDGTASGDTVILDNLTLENGNGVDTAGVGAAGSGFNGVGGGLLVYTNGTTANVTLTDSTISGNSAGPGGYGGGIYNDGTLTITDSTISGNSSYDGRVVKGGGIYNAGTLTITDSTISGNAISAGLSAEGGGIFNDSGTLTIDDSTISGNAANGVAGQGGGIYNGDTVTIVDTILAGNTVTGGGESDYYSSGGTLDDEGYNLFATGGGITGNGVNDVMVAAIGNPGDISSVLAGTESGSGDSLIFTPDLADNGGPTQTIALIVGSPAYLAGGLQNGVTTDQRGDARGSVISIGAWDYDPALLATVVSPVVTSDADTLDVIGATPVTLRDALFYADKGIFGADPTLTFNTTPADGTDFSTAQTITLEQGELLINSSLTLDGPSVGVTINANDASRVLEIDGTASGDTVILDNLTLENGNGVDTAGVGAAGSGFNGVGGGLLVYTNGTTANVTLTDSTISGNSAGPGGYGGGIYNDGTLTITDSTISGNSSYDGRVVKGGGIYNAGTLTITDSTISGNAISAGLSAEGGGIFNDSGTLTIDDSTISGNAANGVAGQGGGIYNGDTVTIVDTILAGNTVTGGGESDYYSSGGTLDDEGYNLFATGGGITGNGVNDVMVAAIGNPGDISSVLAGTESGSGDSLIFTPDLADNGGPTQTIALIVGSPAYLAGGLQNGVTTDQRGDARGSVISIGAWDYDPALLATVVSPVVTSDADTLDVIGATPVTLRDALFYADKGIFGADPTLTFNTTPADGTDFSTAQTITLEQGELLINSSLTLDGPSVGVTINANDASRVLEIDGTASGDTVILDNLTLENGNGVDTAGVGAAGSGFNGVGGGLLVYTNGTTANVTLTDSTISGNSTGAGGGIYNESYNGAATLTINNSTISGNTASFEGGGIYNFGNGGTAAVTLTDSTISGNSASGAGGGIYNNASGPVSIATVTLIDSTISGNSAREAGGGIYNGGNGGGSATLIIGDTILAGNTVNGAESDYYYNSSASVTDNGYNLFATGGGITGNGVNDVMVAAIGNPGDISSVLAGTESGGVFTPDLTNNGGPTATIALVEGTTVEPDLAIGNGGPNVGGYELDQRGYARPADNISIGAYEYDSAGNPFVITSIADDAADGPTYLGQLRTALAYASANPLLDPTITFNTTSGDGVNFSTPQTITLDGSELLINTSLTLDGPSVGVTINAHQQSRVMEIDGTASGDTVNLTDLTLTGGDGVDTAGVGAAGSIHNDNGGGLLIYTNSTTATVNITDSTISGNSGGVFGGGIDNYGNGGTATLTLTDSTISGNSAGTGGGIFNQAALGTASVTINNSTISGNSGGVFGGGIYNMSDGGSATVTITDSTISGNSVGEGGVGGGGIYNYDGTVTIGDTILAGNTAGGSESDYFNGGGGTLNDAGYNLYGSGGGYTGSAPGDINFSGSISTVLAPLGNYGGPTETMALVVGSPAYLAGGPQDGVTTDQRGDPRGSVISIGAWDYDPTVLATVVSPVVTSNADTLDIIGATPVTLRDAIFYADEGIFGTDPTITFASSSGQFNGGTANTIDLDLGELLINNSLSIDATSVGGVTLNANQQSRVLEIDGTAAGDAVTLDNLTLTGGSVSGTALAGDGGGLLVDAAAGNATVTINDSTIEGNSAGNGGGGILNLAEGGNASLTIDNSTFTGNSSPNGGAVANLVVSGNATTTVENSTISGNTASTSGGGIYNALAESGSATVNIGDTILAGNTLTGGGESDYANGGGGTLNDAGYNLYGQNNNTGGFAPSTTVAIADTDILLGTDVYVTSVLAGTESAGVFTPDLAPNGGPTETIALVAGSPALGNGSATLDISGFTLPTTDQRGYGYSRETGPSGAQVVDIGAYQDQGTSVMADVMAGGTLTYGAGDTVTVTLTSTAGQDLGTVTLTDAVNNDTATGPLVLQSNGTYVATIALPTDFDAGSLSVGVSAYGHYAAATANTLTISPDPITITPNTGQSVIYSTATATGNAGLTYTSSAEVGSVPTLTGSLGGYAEGDSVAGGPYSFTTGTLNAGSNYSVSLVASPATFAVAADPITITPNTGQSVIYSTATATGNASLTYTSSAEVGSVPTLTGSLGGYAEGDSVAGGPYNFTTGTLSGGSNYSISLVASPATFAVAADPITITPNTGQSVIYSTATATGNAGLTYTSSAEVGSVPTLTGSLGGYTQGDSVAGGPYAFTTGTLNAGSNYSISLVASPATFTVAVDPITITPNTGQSVIYSTATATGNDSLTYTSSALVGSVPTLTGSLGGYTQGDSVAGGPYAFTTGTLSGGSNYSISLVASPATFAVAADPITITPNTGQSVIYSTATATGNASLTYTSSAEVGSVPTLTGSLGGYTEGDSVTGGPYNFALGTLSAGSNYSISLVASPATFAVAADPITITPSTGQSVIYSTATATGNDSFTYTSSALVGSTPSLTGNLGGYTEGDNVAGGYNFTTGTLSGGSNYSISLVASPATFAVTADPITITPNTGQSVIYSTATATGNASLTYTSSAEVGSVPTLTGSLGGYTEGDSVAGGPYAFTTGTLNAGSNYSISLVASPATFTVAVDPITITPNTGQSVIYSTATATGNDSLTYTSSALVGSVPTLTGSLGGYTQGDSVAGGPYAFTTGTLSGGSNYSISLVASPATFAVTADPITITPNTGQSVIYSTATATGNDSFTYTSSALVGSTPSLTGNLGGYAEGDSVAGGPYAFTTGTLNAGSNYSVSLVASPATFAVTADPITITPNTGQSVIYSTATATGNAGLTYTSSAEVGSVPTLTGSLGGYTEGDSVAGGPYAFTTGTLNAGSNYSISLVASPATFTVAVDPITITPNTGQSVIYSTATATGNDSLTYTSSALVGSVPTLTGSLGGYTQGDSVAGGPYAFTTGTLSGGSNYSISLVASPATFAVAADPITITPNTGQSVIYSTATATGNASLTYTSSAEVGSVPTLTGSLGGYTEGDSVTGGPYNFALGTLSAGSNYSISLVASPATFAVTADPITITPNTGQSVIYSTATATGNDSFTYTSSALVGSTPSLTGNLGGYTEGDNVAGGYNFTTGTLNAGSNYTLNITPSTFTVSPATLTYVANPATRYVGVANPTFIGTVTGFVDDQNLGDATRGTLTFTSPANESSPAGSYAIDGSGLTADYGNYIFVQAPGNATALTVAGFPSGQPFEPFSTFSAQFNANAGYNTFFTQSWFPLFDAGWNNWLVPVFSPGNEPHPVYSDHGPRYGANGKTPGGVIAFGSSFQYMGPGGAH